MFVIKFGAWKTSNLVTIVEESRRMFPTFFEKKRVSSPAGDITTTTGVRSICKAT